MKGEGLNEGVLEVPKGLVENGLEEIVEEKGLEDD